MSPPDNHDVETATHLHASLRMTLDYLCTRASLADLFLLQERLSAQAAQVAWQQPGMATAQVAESARQQALQRELNRQQSQAMEQLRPRLDQYRQEG
jgi:hypothetical protein